jgi:hypothetical protein
MDQDVKARRIAGIIEDTRNYGAASAEHSISSINQMLAFDPNDKNLLKLIAVFHQLAGTPEAALPYAEHYHEVYPEDEDGLVQLCQLAYQVEDARPMRKYADIAALMPETHKMAYCLGLYAQKECAFAAAIRHYRIGLERIPPVAPLPHGWFDAMMDWSDRLDRTTAIIQRGNMTSQVTFFYELIIDCHFALGQNMAAYRSMAEEQLVLLRRLWQGRDRLRP